MVFPIARISAVFPDLGICVGWAEGNASWAHSPGVSTMACDLEGTISGVWMGHVQCQLSDAFRLLLRLPWTFASRGA